MQATVTVTPAALPEVLLNVALVRPVFLWGAPGIGKSSLVRAFAESLGLECVTLLGTQLAPEDLIGVPQIVGDRQPVRAARVDRPRRALLPVPRRAQRVLAGGAEGVLLADPRPADRDLRAAQGSVVIGAGNRATDNALARPMPSALVNRMIHVHLRASVDDWLVWASANGVHRWVVDHLVQRPDHLWSAPPKTEEPFSTPRGWHMLSDALHAYGETVDGDTLAVLAHGTLSPVHASAFRAYVKTVRARLRPRCRHQGRGGLAARPARP